MNKLWTADEQRWLVYWWGAKTAAYIARKLGRTECGVRQKARKLGLDSQLVRLSALAREFGVDRDSLRAVLKKAGVVGLLMQDQRRRGKRYCQRVAYNRDDAREAFEAWHSRETLRAAAIRLDKNTHWLKRRLVATGAFRATWGHRYTGAEIEAATRVTYRTERDARGRVVHHASVTG